MDISIFSGLMALLTPTSTLSHACDMRCLQATVSMTTTGETLIVTCMIVSVIFTHLVKNGTSFHTGTDETDVEKKAY